MKLNNKGKIIAAAVIVVLIAGFIIVKKPFGAKKGPEMAEITPEIRDISVVISATGAVQPMNRLEIKPPIAGRIEKVLVKEGDVVSKGKVLALMSSSERAALLDAARAQGTENVKKWEEIYKPISVIAPITGTVIVRGVEPGQTVGTAEAVFVLSDRLVIKTSVDETDVGKVKVGQKAVITLDAYSESEIPGSVYHISYESSVLNNVSIYETFVNPDKVPDFFRSGMTANVNIIKAQSMSVLSLPVDAVRKRDGVSFVLVKAAGKPQKKEVITGIDDGAYIEIKSGLTPEDIVLAAKNGYVFQAGSAKNTGTSPFMPKRPAGRR